MGTEQQLVDYVVADLDQIEPELTLIGQERVIGGVRPDLLLRDVHGRPLIVEFKRGTANDKAMNQLMDYIKLVSTRHPDVRGMIIAERVPPNLQRSLEHHGLGWREIRLPTTVPPLLTPFDAPDGADRPKRVRRAAGHRRIARTDGEVMLVPAGLIAYPLYKQESMYCRPSSYGRPRRDTARIAFYAQGIMPEIPLIETVLEDVNPLDRRALTSRLGEGSGHRSQSIADALERWHAAFAREYDVSSATLFLLSSPDDRERTARRNGALFLAPGEKAFQGPAYFRLEHLLAATSITELRELRDAD